MNQARSHDAEHQTAEIAGQERRTRIVAATSLLVSLIYIVWRWGWTLNDDALWFSIPFATAETYGLVTAFFLTLTAWRLKKREPRPALRNRTVDVFITTFDEPLSIVRKTALAARELHYEHDTYILDDGRREEIKTLAKELGINYLRRESNENAKAGNLNNALKHTTGEFVLQLDADHVPLPHMIERLIGYFEDEKLAFVQSPQDFYNTDGFTYDVDEKERRIWEDQQLFFRVLQPGKDRLGAAFFVGSCALLRRSALQEIGGFATGTITEDIETSLLLHAAGWRSAYVNETLAYGLAPTSATAFHVQHLRWGQGAMQALRKYKPLRMRGLTMAQRIAYFDSLTTYLGGFQRLILYLAPIAFFFTGAFPLRATATEFAVIFVPYISLQILSFKLLARGHGSLLLADRYCMAKFFTHILSVTGYVRKRGMQFRVTPKGVGDVPLRTYAPQLLLVCVTVVAIAWSIPMQLTQSDYDVPGWGPLAFWVNLTFALWNAAVAWQIVRMSLRMKQKRADHRFSEAMPVETRVIRADGKLSALELAVVENLNPQGVALRCSQPLEDGTRVELTLPLSTRSVNTRGRVVHRQEMPNSFGSVYMHGIQFDDLEWDSRDAIELHCAHHSTPLTRQQYDEGATNKIARFLFRDSRSERRVAVGLPAWLTISHNGDQREIGLGLLEDVSSDGARLITEHPVAPGSHVRLETPNGGVSAEGRVAFVRPLETTLGIRFVVGIDTRTESPDEPVLEPIPQPVAEPVVTPNPAPPPVVQPKPAQVVVPAVLTTLSLTQPPKEEIMERNADNALMTIAGSSARIEGKFEIENSIEIECEVAGELNVGGKLVIGRNGRVNADVQTVDALIVGTYAGNLVASGSIEIASSGRVSGNVETPEFIIEKGGVFTGNVTRPAEPRVEAVQTLSIAPAVEIEEAAPMPASIPLEPASAHVLTQ